MIDLQAPVAIARQKACIHMLYTPLTPLSTDATVASQRAELEEWRRISLHSRRQAHPEKGASLHATLYMR
jgi:hypothetical protein